ncbi:MAG: PAS domain S-box protein [Alkalispirochaetaceae bacterium]
MERAEKDVTPRKRRLLLVEDEAIIALSQRAILEGYGYSVETALSGEKAIASVEAGSFDLVLMDIDLGSSIDGIEAAQRILATRSTPIVFLTSHSERSTVEQVKGITRYGYVLKNSPDHVLLEAIDMALELFEAREELRQAKEMYKSAANLTGDIIVRADAKGRWTFINREGERVWGIKFQEVIGQEFWQLIHPDDRLKTAEAIDWMMKHGKPVTGLVNRNRTVNGWGRYEWNAVPISGRGGRVEGFQATGRDVTGREEYRRETRLKTHAIESSANGIVFADREFRITYANPAALGLWGFEEPREVLGRRAQEFLALGAPLEESLLKALAGEPQVAELTGLRTDGTPFDVEIRVSGIREGANEITALMAILVDISERERRKKEISRLLGQQELLITEFRHRVKNDMSLIQSLLRLQARYAEDRETSDSILEAADRISVLTRVYDRVHTTSDSRRISAGEMLHTLVADLEDSTIPPGARVRLDIEEVEICDRGSISLGLIVNELVTNAVKHAADCRGRCNVTVTLEKSDTGLDLSVSDDGPGYPEDVISGYRYGYGLTVVQELAGQHNGEVRLRNGPGATAQVRNFFSRDLDGARDDCVA